MKLKSKIITKQLIIGTFLIPILIVVLCCCAELYLESRRTIRIQAQEIESRMRKEKIWVKNIGKILISNDYREDMKNCFRCSVAGGHLSSEGAICIVESKPDCCTLPAFCDCLMGTMSSYTIKELQKWYPEDSLLQKLKIEDIDRCFH
jgi:hypothetical protein